MDMEEKIMSKVRQGKTLNRYEVDYIEQAFEFKHKVWRKRAILRQNSSFIGNEGVKNRAKIKVLDKLLT